MNILVTGGAGFIGSHIAEYFLSEGHNVRIVDNLSSGYQENIPESAEFVNEDIYSVSPDVFEGVDYVFHEAALVSVPVSCQQPEEAFRINTLGTMNVLQNSLDAGVEKVVLASSAAVYGNNPILPKMEDMLPEPASPYAISKMDCEYLAGMFHDKGLRTTCLRYFNVYGPRQDPNSPYAAVIPIFMKRAKEGKDLVIYGDGTQTRDFVNIQDVVRANVAAMDNGDGDVFNVATGTSVSVQEIAETIIEITGSSSDIVYEEEREGDIKDSVADVSKISGWWESKVDLEEGLKNFDG
ncbi:NAD-dependent epimerase/dehydratase (plasmid) [Methanohalobium evestigatum Z-7303]|uniref:NAD-dependent epimerase/dehydratase n=2 Tax=Methanohalobium evestigatum TaxID=2322 RepID=D7EBX6_METEZ|nr:NAD-dependent epimerase/dehydratase [Methanohalobium evestigatum Z-7303]